MDFILGEQLAALRQSFFDEGTLEKGFFVQLEQLEGPDTPTFVEEIITLFYNESMKTLAAIEIELNKDCGNFNELKKMLNQIKVHYVCIGAKAIKEKAISVLNNMKGNNIEGAKASLQEVKMEYGTLMGKLEPYFQLRREARLIEKAATPTAK